MVFQQAIERLIELGFYKFFLPFIIVATIVYAILRKSQVLGDSPLINGIISISIAFFIFGLPVLVGVELVKPLTSFFGQAMVVILIITFGLLITGLFVPNLMERMGEWITRGGIVWWMIIIVLVIAITSGLFYFITSPLMKLVGKGKNIFMVMFFLLIFILIVAIVSRGRR